MMGKIIKTGITFISVNFILLPAIVTAESSELCTFKETNTGSLIASGKPRPNKLVTFEDLGGTPIEMDITCREPAKLSVSAPIQVAGPEFTPVVSETTVTTATGTSTKTGDAPLLLSAGTTSVTVNMSVDRGKRLQAGDYRFTFKFDFAGE